MMYWVAVILVGGGVLVVGVILGLVLAALLGAMHETTEKVDLVQTYHLGWMDGYEKGRRGGG